MVEEVPCRIFIESEDPDGLKGVNREKMQKSQMARYKVTKKYSDALENKDQWTIAAVPSYAWAKKVFPNETKRNAYNKLWDAILETVYVTKDNDPVKEWDNHNKNLKERTKWLNEKKFDYIEYKSSNGTDFRADLIPEAHWCGGGEETLSGNFFNPNLPTQEVFTSPKKGFAEGTLVSTKPLSYHGQLIEDFKITFKDGKAVSWEARENKDLLDKMLSMDEGAPYLGELALIPQDSPIANTGILFYNTLFDENASCHVALGRGFCDTIDGFQEKTLEECQALGVNDSMIHVDFMIGADDLTITGYKDGKAYPIFINGNWAF
jgi:aminopeptidase